MTALTPLDPLVKALSRLPGIGEKSATRLSLAILRDTRGLAADLIKALTHVSEKVVFCQTCQNITTQEVCDICSNPHRDPHLLCVVQEPVDLMMIEQTGDYKGLYHVLHGALSPLDGIGPGDIRIQSLTDRVSKGPSEVILATNGNPEGETTALYLKKILSSFPVKISRIASGIPVGGFLEYTDPKTLSRALGHRREF